MKPRVQIVQCSSGRCDNCQRNFNGMCRDLLFDNQYKETTTIVLEQNRGFFHIRFAGEPILAEPPWVTDGWEPIFVGKEIGFFSDMTSLVDLYRTGPYISLYFSNNQQIKNIHLPIVGTGLELSLLNDLVKNSTSESCHSSKSRESITERLERITIETSNRIKMQIPELNDNTRLRIAQIASHQKSILGRLIPILLDEMTEEVYLDGPNTSIYFDHQKNGSVYHFNYL